MKYKNTEEERSDIFEGLNTIFQTLNDDLVLGFDHNNLTALKRVKKTSRILAKKMRQLRQAALAHERMLKSGHSNDPALWNTSNK